MSASASPSLVTCPHCHGTGQVTIPPEVETIEAYYYGCAGEPGHCWWSSGLATRRPNYRAMVNKFPRIGCRIDGGLCPGSIEGKPYDRTRPEREGEAHIHHIDGWTVLAFWDRSVDSRGGCNSNFVARGTHDYATMRAIAEAQFPTVWKRFRFELKLIDVTR
jgi:hypothetical protein